MLPVKVIIEQGDKQLSVFTLHENVATAFLSGEIIAAEFGAYDSTIPPDGACCHGYFRVRP